MGVATCRSHQLRLFRLALYTSGWADVEAVGMVETTKESGEYQMRMPVMGAKIK